MFKEIVAGIGAGVGAQPHLSQHRREPRGSRRTGLPPWSAAVLHHGWGRIRLRPHPDDLRRMAGAGLAASPTTEVLLEESIMGWKEYELEVMRDHADNVVVICSIENLDPMGVHTGDSITVALR